MPRILSREQFVQSHLFRFMQTVPNDDAGNPAPLPGLPQSGEPDNPDAPALGFVDNTGADLIKGFLEAHNDDGTKSSAAERGISEYELDLLYTLYASPEFSGLCDPTGTAAIREEYGFEDVSGPGSTNTNRPVDAGRLNLPTTRQSMVSESRLASLEIGQLPALFAQEVKERPDFRRGTNEERSAKYLGLLRDYSKALWSHGQTPTTMHVVEALLDSLDRDTRGVGMLLGKQDFCGVGFGAAQRIALGGDPNEFRHDLPNAHVAKNRTYLSMDGGMSEPMKKVDDWLEANGLPRKAEALEKASPLDWLAGNEAGHTKVSGSASEEKAISSTGVRWANIMFPRDAEIRDLPPSEGFEMAIDFLDAFGQFAAADPARGDRFVVEHKDGTTPVKMEKVVQRDGDKPVSWSAKFVHADTGAEIPSTEVLGRFVSADGTPKGDGQGSGSISLWWWGFCDRNTAQGIYKAQFDVPELDIDSVKTRSDVTFTREEAQKLLDAHVGDLVTNEVFWHFRFNDEPQIIQLKNGQQLRGKVSEEIFANRPGGSKTSNEMYGDLVVLHNTPQRRLLGFIEVTREGAQKPDRILAANIESISMKDGKATVHLKGEGDAGGRTIEGNLESELPWGQASTAADGTQTLVQDDSQPIRGFIEVEMGDRSKRKFDVKDIGLIAGEQQVENNVAVHLTMIEKLGGHFGADTSKAATVANSAKHLNKFEQYKSEDDSTPDWWDGGVPTNGREGPVERQRGDSIVYHRGLSAHSPGEEATSNVFSGWTQVDKNGRIVNQGFAEGYNGGEPDFGFGAEGPMEWLNQRSTFNQHMDPAIQGGLLLELMVNGYAALKTDGDQTEAVAKRLNLPSNWRDYRA